MRRLALNAAVVALALIAIASATGVPERAGKPAKAKKPTKTSGQPVGAAKPPPPTIRVRKPSSTSTTGGASDTTARNRPAWKSTGVATASAAIKARTTGQRDDEAPARDPTRRAPSGVYPRKPSRPKDRPEDERPTRMKSRRSDVNPNRKDTELRAMKDNRDGTKHFKQMPLPFIQHAIKFAIKLFFHITYNTKVERACSGEISDPRLLLAQWAAACINRTRLRNEVRYSPRLKTADGKPYHDDLHRPAIEFWSERKIVNINLRPPPPGQPAYQPKNHYYAESEPQSEPLEPEYSEARAPPAPVLRPQNQMRYAAEESEGSQDYPRNDHPYKPKHQQAVYGNEYNSSDDASEPMPIDETDYQQPYDDSMEQYEAMSGDPNYDDYDDADGDGDGDNDELEEDPPTESEIPLDDEYSDYSRHQIASRAPTPLASNYGRFGHSPPVVSKSPPFKPNNGGMAGSPDSFQSPAETEEEEEDEDPYPPYLGGRNPPGNFPGGQYDDYRQQQMRDMQMACFKAQQAIPSDLWIVREGMYDLTMIRPGHIQQTQCFIILTPYAARIVSECLMDHYGRYKTRVHCERPQLPMRQRQLADNVTYMGTIQCAEQIIIVLDVENELEDSCAIYPHTTVREVIQQFEKVQPIVRLGRLRTSKELAADEKAKETMKQKADELKKLKAKGHRLSKQQEKEIQEAETLKIAKYTWSTKTLSADVNIFHVLKTKSLHYKYCLQLFAN